MQPKSTPYNTGKVKIGLAYDPRRVGPLSDEESHLQDALLGLHDNRDTRALKLYCGLVFFLTILLLVFLYAPR
jgi:hypothetical protein